MSEDTELYDTISFRWRQAHIYEQQKDYENAISEYTGIIEKTEDDPFLRCRAFIERAKIYESQGQYDKALVDYSDIIEFSKTHAQWNTGVAYERWIALSKKAEDQRSRMKNNIPEENSLQKIVIPDAHAYWVSPTGEILAVYQTHIRRVIDNPAIFGLTTESITEAYNRLKEPLGFEGKARGEIMEKLIHKGWVRIRLDERRGLWKIELSKLTAFIKEYLRSWANALITVNPDRKYDNAQIAELDNGFARTVLMIEDMADDKLLNK
jgi:tetratricopeptide (TPR) repeat protein